MPGQCCLTSRPGAVPAHAASPPAAAPAHAALPVAWPQPPCVAAPAPPPSSSAAALGGAAPPPPEMGIQAVSGHSGQAWTSRDREKLVRGLRGCSHPQPRLLSHQPLSQIAAGAEPPVSPARLHKHCHSQPQKASGNNSCSGRSSKRG